MACGPTRPSSASVRRAGWCTSHIRSTPPATAFDRACSKSWWQPEGSTRSRSSTPRRRCPISSSGHLILVPWLFAWHELDAYPELKKTFDVALHLGTLFAVLVYFWGDLKAFVPAGLRAVARRSALTHEERLPFLLVVSALPAFVLGAALDSFIEEHLSQPWLVALMLIVFGVVLLIADRSAMRRREEDFRLRESGL